MADIADIACQYWSYWC